MYYHDPLGRIVRHEADGARTYVAPGTNDWARYVAEQGDTPTLPEPAPAPGVPQEVSMRAARRALHAAGLYGAVAPAIAALPEPQRTQAQIDWDYAATVRRDWPFVGLLAMGLGLDDATIDALFVAADQIEQNNG